MCVGGDGLFFLGTFRNVTSGLSERTNCIGEKRDSSARLGRRLACYA